MNTPEINSGNNITSGNSVRSGLGTGQDFSTIMSFLSQLMSLKGGGQQPARNTGGQYGGGPTDPRLNFVSGQGPGSPAQQYFNDTGIVPMGNASGY